MNSYDFDLFTIGAGSGGVRASRLAAEFGARVAIAEADRIGGTCVIRGCIPKKLLVYASHFSEDFADAAAYGWTLGETQFDWPTLVTNKDKEIERLSGLYRRALTNAGVAIFESRAVLKDAHTIHLAASNREVTADKILIATGGRPLLPDHVEGIRNAITSDQAFDLAALPSHVTIVGGGYIAIEFAGIFGGLGAEVTLVHHGPRLLRVFDRDLGVLLADEMRKKGIVVRLGCTLTAIERTEHGYRVTTGDGGRIETDLVMYAVGRRPNVEGLGLDRIGVEQRQDGAIVVDNFLRTTVPHIHAIGDATHRLQLTPVAIREGQAFAETVFNQNPQEMSYESVATAIFCQPPVGTVGLSEDEAVRRYEAVVIYETNFRPLKHTLTGRDERTYMKLVVSRDDDRVRGCHILGADAAEMIQCVAIAVKMGATKSDFDSTVAVHPTSAEELVTLRRKRPGKAGT